MSLAEPERLRCGACHYDGPPPAEVAASLRTAAASVHASATRARQLGGLQRRVLRSGALASFFYLLFGTIGLSPCLCCLVVYVVPEHSGDATLWVCAGMPVLMTALTLALGLVAISRARRRLGAACAALPPPRPGAPAGCHVCGGPVEVVEGQPFARCAFCGADNLVDRRLVARWHVERAQVIEDYGQTALRESKGVGAATRAALLPLVTLVFLGPALGVCCGASSAVVLERFESEPVDEERFTVMTTPLGPCIARVGVYSERAVLSVDPALERAGVAVPVEQLAASVPTFGWRSLVGLRVTTPTGGTVSRDQGVIEIVRVHGVLGRRENRARTRPVAGGEERSLPPYRLCLADGTPSPVPPFTPSPVAPPR